MNNRGQLGEGAIWPVILFVVFVIMSLFVAMSAGIFKIVNPTGDVAGLSADPKIPYSYDLLFKNVNIKINDATKQLSVFDLLIASQINFRANIQDRSDFLALTAFLSQDKPCLIAAQYEMVKNGFETVEHEKPDYYYLKYVPGAEQHYTSIIQDYDTYKDAGVLSYVKVLFKDTNQAANIVYYYGRCLT